MVDKLVGDHGWELELRVRGVFAAGRSWSATRWRRTPPPRPSPTASSWCGPTRPPGHPAQAARAQRRTPPQRGPRRRHRDRPGGARPARPELEEGPAVEPGRPGSARHLRLSRGRRPARADLRAARRYRESPAPLFGRPGCLHRPLRGVSVHKSPRPPGAVRGMRPSDRLLWSRPSPRFFPTVHGLLHVQRRKFDTTRRPRDASRTHRSPPTASSTTPPRSRSSRASRRSASARACTSARPASAACTT